MNAQQPVARFIVLLGVQRSKLLAVGESQVMRGLIRGSLVMRLPYGSRRNGRANRRESILQSHIVPSLSINRHGRDVANVLE